ncbi:hypothetical protein MishRS11D_45500 (plasmid) [Methylomagnum ishizawai]|nr:hypothetical protein MishRS11D_45500 [Methylomagnum ishizawai]
MAKTIDFQAVKESLAALDRIAAEHPELLGESSQEEWEQTLKSTVLERQKRLITKRQAEGQERHALWAPREEIEELRRQFPGSRNGVNWRAVIAAALKMSGQNPENTGTP